MPAQDLGGFPVRCAYIRDVCMQQGVQPDSLEKLRSPRHLFLVLNPGLGQQQMLSQRRSDCTYHDWVSAHHFLLI